MSAPVDVLAELSAARDALSQNATYPADVRLALARIEKCIPVIGGLLAAATEASATLGHAYHTALTGSLAEHAHTDYQRLDQALERATRRKEKRQAKQAEHDAALARVGAA